jgi:hypothetical protein
MTVLLELAMYPPGATLPVDTLCIGDPQKTTPLSYTCNHAVKTYGGVEIKILLMLPSALNGS